MEEKENTLPEGQEASDQKDPKDEVQESPENSTKVDSKPDDTEEKEDEAQKPEPVASDEKTQDQSEEHQDDDDEDDHFDEEQKLLETLHLDDADKADLFDALKKFRAVENMRVLDKALKEIKSHYEKIHDAEREKALKEFVASGNDESDFDYKGDDLDTEFHDLYDQLREKKQRYFSQLEKSKDDNLKRKNELLEKLRELVDGEESTTSINALKELQAEWRNIGQVPGAYVKSLWANYNALIDRFYDNRSIYFELKELDRRKNLESKLELCTRAEALDEIDNVKEAIFQLNELHEEFKHIGPVPKDDQESLWQRFKAASDKIYAKRKEYFDNLKHELHDNMEKKLKLGDKAEEFASFTSDKINEWNKKTKEILALQKEWDAIGGLPREKAKQVNKHFWSNFKQFFSNKNTFFKSLEGLREENLKKKEELLEQAEKLKDSEDWEKTANELKSLQNKWRDIGPVPERVRNEVYQKFKKACDHFFEKRRAQSNVQNKEFEQNLKKKEEICEKLESVIKGDTIDMDEIYDLLDAYADIGFVPRNAIKKIHNRYDNITDQLIALDELSEDQRADLKIQVQVSKLKNSPHGSRKIHRKEGAIKRKISTLENDIATWKTNVEFFADSKTANQLKDDFNEKIENASQELEELKKQLNVLNQM